MNHALANAKILCQHITSKCGLNCLHKFINRQTRSSSTCKVLLEKWEKKFSKAGIFEPELSSLYILLHVFGYKQPSDIDKIQSRILTTEQEDELNRLCLCRLSRMPIQYVIGEWDFRDFTVQVKPPVFIPRPETEQLVEIVLAKYRNRIVRILEIGCGSGVVSVSLLKDLPQATCIAIDQSKLACRMTLENARRMKVDDRLTVLNEKIDVDGVRGWVEDVDLIVSNPPYVPQKELFDLQKEILLYEDLRALDGGIDGFCVIKDILDFAPKILKFHGRLFLEVHPIHPLLIEKYVQSDGGGLTYVQTYKDFAGKDRFVELKLH